MADDSKEISVSQAANPLVSVIIPCYNQGAYLEEAVASVLAQTYPEFEIIVVNDGSTDSKTVELLSNAQFSKTKVLHKPNGGVSSARNFGIKESQGKYFLPLDADDKIGPHYLEHAVKAIEQNSRTGIVYCNAEYFGAKAGPVYLPEFSVVELLTECGIFCSALFRKEDWVAVNGFKEDMVFTLEDYDFWISVVSLGREVVRLPDCHFFYRIKDGSRSTACTDEQYYLTRRQIYERHREFYLKHADALFDRLVHLSRENIRRRNPWAHTPIQPIGAFVRQNLYRARRTLLQLFGRD